MFRRQFTALDYPSPDAIDLTDRTQFANIVLWLEDQKIRCYPIEGRAALRQIGPSDDCKQAWEAAYAQFKCDVHMPDGVSTPIEEMSWLLGRAVRLEYLDQSESYADITGERVAEQQQRNAQPTVHTTNALDSLDQSSAEFQAGVTALAAQLHIDAHPDHVVRLQAAASLIAQKLRPAAIAEQPPRGMAFPVKEGSRCAFDDADVDQAAKILRLLQVHHVRSLQTAINETIVAVQELTADPKTDSKLGKVGVK